MATQPRQQQGGLSIQTLAIASLASAAAAIVVHEVWRGGAILGAAITPVIVAIVSESLRKPVDRVAARREARRQAVDDRFGIWEEERPRRRLNARHLKIALVTGALAFIIGAFALTATELVFGGNVGSGGRDTTIVGGGSNDRDTEEKTTTTETQPEAEEPAPTTTPDTTPTVPAEEPSPTTTAPLPEGATPPPTDESAPASPETTPAEPPAAEPAPAEPTP